MRDEEIEVKKTDELICMTAIEKLVLFVKDVYIFSSSIVKYKLSF